MSHHVADAHGTPDADTSPVARIGPQPIRIGTLLRERYRLTHVIGRGGMADVYRATDEVLGRPVAIKAFRPSSGGDSERQRFLGEVRTLAGLAHPHLVQLFDGGQDDAQPWCAMHYLDGGTFADLVGPPDTAAERGAGAQRVAAIGAQIADGLAYIHERGIVHRDVKPSNVLLDTDGEAYLSDFGVAQMVDATRMTSTGSLLGTAAYLSPEQVLGRPATSAVDIYALGLVLLEALTGRREFPGAPIESAVARLSRSPQIPDTLGPQWSDLLTRMTSLDPADRPDAAAVADTLAGLTGETRRLLPTPEGSEDAVGTPAAAPRSPVPLPPSAPPHGLPAQRPAPARVQAIPAGAQAEEVTPVRSWRPPTWEASLPPAELEDSDGPTHPVLRLLALAPVRNAGLAVAGLVVAISGWQLAGLGTGPVTVIPQSSLEETVDGADVNGGGLAVPSTGVGNTLAPSATGMGRAGSARRSLPRNQALQEEVSTSTVARPTSQRTTTRSTTSATTTSPARSSTATSPTTSTSTSTTKAPPSDPTTSTTTAVPEPTTTATTPTTPPATDPPTPDPTTKVSPGV